MRTSLLSALVLLCGCALVESAGEVTFGEQSIERVRQDIPWPSADELSGLSSDETSDIDGFPSSLEKGTLAHLAGALGAGGECRKRVESADLQSEAIRRVAVSMAVCAGDDRCAAECGDDFRGMVLETRVTLVLANEAQLADLKESLADVTPDAIVQIRLQFFALWMYQAGPDGERVDTTSKFRDWSLTIGDGTIEVPLVSERHLPLISEETPQRFDVDERSQFTKDLKRSIIAGQSLEVTLTQRMRVPRSSLYDLHLEGSGTGIEMQPELVIHVVDVAASSF